MSDARDETTRDAQSAWQEVGDRFAGLGKVIRDQYESSDDEGVAGPSGDEVKSAIGTITDMLDRAVNSIGSAMREPDVRSQAKEAIGSLAAALAATFGELGEDLTVDDGMVDMTENDRASDDGDEGDQARADSGPEPYED